MRACIFKPVKLQGQNAKSIKRLQKYRKRFGYAKEKIGKDDLPNDQ